MSISDKQKGMLAFIENFVEENGYPPTHEEIRAGLNISTKSLVNYHLEALENAALLSRSPNTPRGIRLTGDSETFQVPLMGHMTAVSVNELSNNLSTKEVIELTCDIVPHRNNLYAFKVKGNALLDALVNEGDIVILQRQSKAQNGDMVAVRLVDQNQIMLKRFYRENGHVRLQPANPTFEPLIVSPKVVEIQGKVMAIIRQVN